MGANFNGAVGGGGNPNANPGFSVPYDPYSTDNFSNPGAGSGQSVQQVFGSMQNMGNVGQSNGLQGSGTQSNQLNTYLPNLQQNTYKGPDFGQPMSGIAQSSQTQQGTGLANDLPPINQQNPYGTTTYPTMQGMMGSGQQGTGLAGGMPPAQTMNTSASTQPSSIADLYQTVLHRAPDAAGQQFWQNALNNGMSMADVQRSFTQAAAPELQQQQSQQQSSTPAATEPYAQNPYGITGANATNLQGSTNPYIQAAQQTSLGNLAGAQNATAANRVNQSTPYSNLNYTQTGTDANGNPIWSANQTLAGPLAGAQSSLAQGVANQAAQGFNPNTPSVGINPGQLYSDAIMQRLQPQQAHAQQQQAASLANQGIAPGTDAYNNAMRTFQQGQNDQLTSAQVGGIGVGLQANQQAFNQQLQQANLPYQQLGAFQQATQPGYVNAYNQQAVSGPDYTNAYSTAQNAQIAQQNQQIAQQANLQNGLFGLGSSAILGAGGVGNLANSAVNGATNAYNWLTGLGTNAANNTMSQVNQGLLSPTAGGSIYNSLPGIDTSLTQGMVG